MLLFLLSTGKSLGFELVTSIDLATASKVAKPWYGRLEELAWQNEVGGWGRGGRGGEGRLIGGEGVRRSKGGRQGREMGTSKHKGSLVLSPTGLEPRKTCPSLACGILQW